MSNDNAIDTSAEQLENLVIPMIHEVHTDPDRKATDLPKAMQGPKKPKSAAHWAYERIILYIQKFEETLDADHEVGVGFANGGAGVMKIEGLGYFDPDIVTYFGSNENGSKTQLIQHVSQLNVMLVATPKQVDQAEPNRIGFRLAKELEEPVET